MLICELLVISTFWRQNLTSVPSIRFAPPLVISEEELMKAVHIIELSLNDLDKVIVIAFSSMIVTSR